MQLEQIALNIEIWIQQGQIKLERERDPDADKEHWCTEESAQTKNLRPAQLLSREQQRVEIEDFIFFSTFSPEQQWNRAVRQKWKRQVQLSEFIYCILDDSPSTFSFSSLIPVRFFREISQFTFSLSIFSPSELKWLFQPISIFECHRAP